MTSRFHTRRAGAPERAFPIARAILLAVAVLARAVAPAPADAQLPPVRPLGPIVGRIDSIVFARGFNVLSDGRVVVNDISRRRIAFYDSTLSHTSAVVDTSFGGKIFGYLADTSLLLSPTARALVVMDPSGRLARTLPLATSAIMGDGTPFTTHVDAHGRIVFQELVRRVPVAAGAPPVPDSILVERLDVRTGVIDTVTTFAAPRVPFAVSRADIAASSLAGNPLLGGISLAGGGIGFITILNAAPAGGLVSPATAATTAATTAAATGVGVSAGGGGAGSDRGGDTVIFTRSLLNVAAAAGLSFVPARDGWAVLSDGTIAVARGQEHRIDLYGDDGLHAIAPPLPYGAPRLTGQAKAAFVDSLKREWAAHPAPTDTPSIVLPDMKVLVSAPAFPDPATIPDYEGWFAQLKADADGNLWIEDVRDQTVWAVVDRRGQVIDRVRIPAGMSIEWFGAGVVYLTTGVGISSSLLKARIR